MATSDATLHRITHQVLLEVAKYVWEDRISHHSRSKSPVSMLHLQGTGNYQRKSTACRRLMPQRKGYHKYRTGHQFCL